MKEKIPTPEQFKQIELKIKEPDPLHGWEIWYEEENTGLVTAYNVAIQEICNKQNEMGMFHQGGFGNEPGWHAWEVLGSKTDESKLSEIITKIHEDAQKRYKRLKEHGII